MNMENDEGMTCSSSDLPTGDTCPDESRIVEGEYHSSKEIIQFSSVTSEVENFVDSGDIMPQVLEFSSDDSVSSTDMFYAEENNLYPTKGGDDSKADVPLSAAEESVAFGDSQFDNFAQLIDNTTAASTCFSRSSLLVCDDSLDSVSKEATSFSTVMQSGAGVEQWEIDDSPVTTLEETSMDSGLGSVESTGVNSEEEGAPSPNICLPPSFIRDEKDEQALSNQQNVKENKFYDCISSMNDLASENNKKRTRGEWDDYETTSKRIKKEKSVGFCDVTAYYFPRRQGFVSVPSQGGSTLGMDIKHVYSQTMTLQQHKHDVKQKHKKQVKQHMKEQKIENRMKQLRTLNPDLDVATVSSMAANEISRTEQASDESDNDDSLLDNVDDFFFLQPIPAKKRREILRSAGVERIDGEEKLMNRLMRQSREMCGCSCTGLCMPESCECAHAGIQCQVDRDSFPCGCVISGCRNPTGRIEFDSERVRLHTEATMKRLQLIEEGANSDCAAIEKEAGSTSGSESECDLLSSDDADHSESESIEFADHFVGDTNVSRMEYNKSSKQEAQQGFQQNAEFWNFAHTPDHDSGRRPSVAPQTQQNSYFTDEAIWTGEFPPEEKVPQEFLDGLDLQRIEEAMFFPRDDQHSNACVQDAAHVIQTIDPLYDGWSEYFATENNQTLQMHFSQPATGGLGAADPFSSESRVSQSMYGTTSPRRDCQSVPATRDCAVLLDPIATFMSSTYTVSTSGSVS